MLAIFYLQKIGMLPNLQSDELTAGITPQPPLIQSFKHHSSSYHPIHLPPVLTGLPRVECEGLDVTFCRDPEVAKAATPPLPRLPSLAQLLLGFFHFLGTEINTTRDCISIRRGQIISKEVRHQPAGMSCGRRG